MEDRVKLISLLITSLVMPSLHIEVKAEVDKNVLIKKFSALQMPFIENQGQINDKSVKFYANTFAGTVFVTEKGEIVYSLIKTEDKAESKEHREIKDKGLKDEPLHSQTKVVAIKETLVSPKQIKITSINRQETRVNYFKGPNENWRTNIPTWQEVSLGEVYKGIELKLKAYGDNIEKLFTVYPEGSVSDIKLAIEGAKGLRVNEDGELEVDTELGTVKFTKPFSYQEIDGKRVEVEVSYEIQDARYRMQDNNSKLIYGFQVAKYDHTKPLIIDPLLSSTFIGGSDYDCVLALALDPSGNVFVAEYTRSSNYPVTSGVYDTTYNGGYGDVFISKLNNDLSSLLSSTFIGGRGGGEGAHAFVIDPSGNVFVAGSTLSSNYPVTQGAYDTTHNGGGYDGFISKLSNDLSNLLSSTFIGGSSSDYAYALAIVSSGNVFVAGDTYSSNYPVTSGACDTTYNGGYGDVFVSKLNNDLSSLLSSTFRLSSILKRH